MSPRAPSAWRWLWPWLKRRRGLFLAALALAWLTALAGVALLGVSGWFIVAAALAGSAGGFNLFVPSSLVRALSFVRIGSRYAERIAGHAATLRLQADLRVSVFRQLIPRTPDAARGVRPGEFAAGLVSDVESLDIAVLQGVIPCVVAWLLGLALAVVLGQWSALAGWTVCALAVGAIGVLPWALRRAGAGSGAEVQHWRTEVHAQVVDSVEAHADLLALNAQPAARRRFSRANRAWSRARSRQDGWAILGQVGLQLVGGAAVLCVLWFGLDALVAGRLTAPWLVGSLLAAMGWFEALAPRVRGAARMGMADAAAARLWRWQHIEPAVVDPVQPVPLPAGGAVAWEQVSFAYPGRPDQPVLSDWSLAVAEGERVALVGPSGGGKSTALHLLLRLHDVQAGTVRVAGQDVRDITQAALHARITLMAQDAPVFAGTVRENLCLGLPAETRIVSERGSDPLSDTIDERLWAALADAQLADWVTAQPAGLDTRVGETGALLSAGQARRLCLARALLRDTPVLLLDEPTAGLDGAAQQAFFQVLAQVGRGRTVVVATHAALPPGVVDRIVTLPDSV